MFLVFNYNLFGLKYDMWLMLDVDILIFDFKWVLYLKCLGIGCFVKYKIRLI